jgi:hypothetical protein
MHIGSSTDFSWSGLGEPFLGRPPGLEVWGLWRELTLDTHFCRGCSLGAPSYPVPGEKIEDYLDAAASTGQ